MPPLWHSLFSWADVGLLLLLLRETRPDWGTPLKVVVLQVKRGKLLNTSGLIDLGVGPNDK